MSENKKTPFLQNSFDEDPAPVAPKPSRRGPKTDRGRAAVRENARTHCITSNDPVIPDIESQEDWDRHLAGFIDYFAPVGAVESFLVERYANLLWRYRRVTRYEVSAVMRLMVSVGENMILAANYPKPRDADGVVYPDEHELFASMHNVALPSTDATDKITRYEAHLQRQAIQTLRQLFALQARRTGDAPPVAADVKGLAPG